MTNTEATATAPVQPYTDSEATDEAVLLFTRKLRRLQPEAFAAVMAKMPQGARDALTLAENRADSLRDRGGERRFVTIAERAEAETGGEE